MQLRAWSGGLCARRRAQSNGGVARYRRGRMKVFSILGLVLSMPFLVSGQQADDDQRLAHGNEALRAWLAQIDADVPYLLVDRAAREVRLMQGRVLLRSCPLQRETLASTMDPRTVVSARVRRYRTLDPWSKIEVGPFDWEERLVHSAPDDGALYFANGLLLCADPVWQQGVSPLLIVSARDLRALFNACPEGMPLVVLPEDWQRSD